MFTFWDFALFYALAVGAVVGFATYKFIAKPIIRKIKARKANKAQQTSNIKSTQNIKSKEKNSLKAKSKVEDFDLFETTNNVFHTTENYDQARAKNSKYNKIKAKTEKLSTELELTGETSTIPAKSLYKNKKKLVGLLKTPTTESENLQCDYVKKENGEFDKRTYIQIFDDEKANEFKNFVESNNSKDDAVFAMKVAFGKSSGKKPLRLSATNDDTIQMGNDLISEKIYEIITNETAENAKTLFPITIDVQQGNQKKQKVFNSKEEYDKFINDSPEQDKNEQPTEQENDKTNNQEK